jgi:hypothetical protein
MEIFEFLDIFLNVYMKNKYEYQREKLIVLVHWTFLSRKFSIMKNESVRKSFFQSQLINLFFRIKEIMNWRKSEKNSIDVDYFREDLIIHVEQFFDKK